MLPRSLCALFTLTLLTSCEAEAPEATAPRAPSTTPMPLRLAEILTRDHVVRSPMLTADAKAAPVPAQVVFEEDFEQFTPRELGWQGNGVQAVARPGGKGRALRYHAGGAHKYVLVLPAEGRARYRLQRGLRTSDLNVDVRVMETRTALRHPAQRNHPKDVASVLHGKFVSLKELIRVHHFPPAAQADRWQLDTLSVHTNPDTRSLVLMFDDAESVVAATSLQVFLDDLRVERLRPAPEQELAWLKDSEPAPGADAALGMAKHGQLLPPGDASRALGAHQHNFDYRYGILAPAPTLVSFPVTLPARARLSLSYGLHKASRPGDGARFVVRVLHEGKPRDLLDQTVRLDAKGEAWRWYEADLDLGTLAGQSVQVQLESLPLQEGSTGLAVWGSPIIDVPRSQDDPPNIIFVGMDTLRADHLSCYGNPNRTSPNLDALAADGIRFEHAISSANWTTSAFASMFTGLLPSQHRVIHRARAIAPSLTTLPEAFHQAGWLTQAVAYKAYLYNMGFEQGFDAWFNQPRSDNNADDNLSHALTFLERHGDRRFFLFFHLNDPHQPFNQPAPFDTMFVSASKLREEGVKLPITVGTKGQVLGCARCSDGNEVRESFKPVARALYDGAVAFADDRLGKLIDALKARGIYDDTLIVFVADHGEIMWDRANYFGHGGVHLTDDLVRVPLLLKPHRGSELAARKGEVVAKQVRTWDVFPTLTEMLGLPTPTMEAESLISLIKDPAVPARVAVSENVKQHVVSVRTNTHKYILDHRPGRPARETLYDLRADPTEQRNVAARNADTLRTLRRVAIEHVVKNHEGRYVLVVGEGAEQRYGVRVSTSTAAREVRTLFGLKAAPRGPRSEVASFQGSSDDTLVLLAQLDVPADAAVAVSVTAGDKTFQPAGGDAVEFLPYKEGLVSSLLDGGPGAYVLAGPTHATTFAEKTEVDGEQLATLKALGYVE